MGVVGGTGLYSATSVTRPNDTTAYNAADVVGGVLEFPVFSTRGRGVLITGAQLMIEANALIASEAGYSLYLYSVTPPSALADNAAWDIPSGDRDAYLGALSLGTPTDLGSSLVASIKAQDLPVQMQSSSIFAYLVTAAGYTPTAERVHRLKLWGIGL